MQEKVVLLVSLINLLKMLYYLPDFCDEFLPHYVLVLVYFHRLQEIQPRKENDESKKMID